MYFFPLNIPRWAFKASRVQRLTPITTFMSSVKRAQLTGQTNQGKKGGKKSMLNV